MDLVCLRRACVGGAVLRGNKLPSVDCVVFEDVTNAPRAAEQRVVPNPDLTRFDACVRRKLHGAQS